MSLTVACDGSGDLAVSRAGYGTVVYNGSGDTNIFYNSVAPYTVVGVKFIEPANTSGEVDVTEGMKLIYDRNEPHKATNNRGELCGLLCAVMIAKSRGVTNMTVITDSKYCIGTFTGWYHDWVRAGITHKKANIDIISIIARNMEGINVNFIHQKAHTTLKSRAGKSTSELLHISLNDIADTYANKGKLLNPQVTFA